MIWKRPAQLTYDASSFELKFGQYMTVIATDGRSFTFFQWLHLTLQNYLGDEALFLVRNLDQDWSMSTHMNITVSMELMWQCEHYGNRQEGDLLVFIDDPGTFTVINAATIIAKV